MVAGLMPSYLTFALILPVCGFRRAHAHHHGERLRPGCRRRLDPRPRVMAGVRGGVLGMPFGAPLLGWIADHWGARWTLIGGGALTAIGTVVAVLISTRRQGFVITRYFRSPAHRTDELGPVVTD